MRQHPLNVLPNHIHFDIYVVAGLQGREIRDFPRLRDDGDFKVFVSQPGDC